MFSYYGSKSKVIDCYPKPKHGRIIEPFAGSARYALKYWENDVTINDKYEVIYGIWKYLQACSVNDIMKMPSLKIGDRIEREKFDCIEQAWLMSFIIKSGTCWPELVVSKFGVSSIERRKKFIAANLFKIQHWKITNLDYTDIRNETATWFIDPPYQFGGHKYKYNKIDFDSLANWCIGRLGQSIVCENTKANWMDFKPIKKMNGAKHVTTEAIWSNETTAYDMVQTALSF